MATLLSPQEWSQDLVAYMDKLNQEKKFMDAVASTGIVTGVRETNDLFLLNCNGTLAQAQQVFPPLETAFDIASLMLPYPVLRDSFTVPDIENLEKPAPLVKNLLVHGLNSNSAELSVEYAAAFAGRKVQVMVTAKSSELPSPDTYRQFRGVYVRAANNRRSTQTGCFDLLVTIPFVEWKALAKGWDLTPEELNTWCTEAYLTACAGGVPTAESLQASFPRIANNKGLSSTMLRTFKAVLEQFFPSRSGSPNDWNKAIHQHVLNTCAKLKAMATEQGVCQPWHEETVARLLETGGGPKVHLDVRRAPVTFPLMAPNSSARFFIRPLGPLSAAITLTLPEQFMEFGLPVLTDSLSLALD